MTPLFPKSRAALATAAAFAALTAGTAHAAGKVEVGYVKPEQFSDAGRFASDREQVQKTLTEFLVGMGRDLLDGQTLRIDILDIDLAGELVPQSARDIRVLRGGADWPRIRLRYALSGPGGPMKSGEVRLMDMNYLQSGMRPEPRDTELPYEKRMLRQWFRATIAAGH